MKIIGCVYLPDDGYRVSKDTNIDQHICNTIAKVEFAVAETMSNIFWSGVSVKEMADRNADVDPGDNDSHPVTADQTETHPESICHTKNSTIEH